jgi:formate hydrogenlyase subunit 6/NADH:ubiquinone oxidoreductase subunit I
LTSAAFFTHLPRQHVLTVRVDIPEPWNVQTKAAVQDIDNLRCVSGKSCGDVVPVSGLASTAAAAKYKQDLTQVIYGLKNVLVAGQCFTTDGSGSGRAPPHRWMDE